MRMGCIREPDHEDLTGRAKERGFSSVGTGTHGKFLNKGVA